MSQLQVNRINDASGGVLAPISSVMRNRIINGACTIDQRNAGASVTPSTLLVYTLDRWRLQSSVASKFSVEQTISGVAAPTGFSDYLGATVVSPVSISSGDYYIIQQGIEGFNTADLNWGTASAATVTLSFWVRSSLTGTFGGSLQNSAQNRSYPFTYTINSANTWEYETITIPGDTTGTWLTNNGIGIMLSFNLGTGTTFSGTAGAWASSNLVSATGATSVVGTNGATFYITGVQLEKGTQATGFEYRQYGQELALCQRYFCSSYVAGTAVGTITITGMIARYTDAAGVYCSVQGFYPVSMRAAPTLTIYGVLSGGTAGQVSGDATNKAGLVAGNGSTTNFFASTNNVSTGAGESIKCNFIASSEL